MCGNLGKRGRWEQYPFAGIESLPRQGVRKQLLVAAESRRPAGGGALKRWAFDLRSLRLRHVRLVRMPCAHR
jgi:hypothetical protein